VVRGEGRVAGKAKRRHDEVGNGAGHSP
jgi:hypothetical protein